MPMSELSEEDFKLYKRQVIWQLLEMLEDMELLQEEEKSRIKIVMTGSADKR